MENLIGTEKQIAWAETIRAAAVANWNSHYTFWTDRIASGRSDHGAAAQIDAIRNAALTCTDASTWIDARTRGGANPDFIIHSLGHASLTDRVAFIGVEMTTADYRATANSMSEKFENL